MRRLRRWLMALAAVSAAGGGLVGAAALYLPVPANAVLDAVPAALVLSGDPDYLRARRAAELQREGRVRFLLMTGAGVAGDNAEELARQAVAHGADATRILTEPRSTTTRENLLLSRPIVGQQGWKRVALVTSRVHMFRALHTARRVMPEVEWLPVLVPDAVPESALPHERLKEWRKIVGYALRGWLA